MNRTGALIGNAVRIFTAAIGVWATSFAAFGEPPPSGAVATVTQLYHDYAWQVVIEEPTNVGIDLFDQPAEVLSRYFDQHMVELIVRDRQCRDRTHEVCRLDYAPIWDSQDPGARDMKIRATPDPSKVAVDFIYQGDSSRMHITYVLSKTREGWRIADIQGSTGSLSKVLESALHP
ncbi:DUF3828 domain-containing protein [Dyella acidisoli]|uniref:DUF3828 domain-containing protein n=1 Tax=Dyella acidisoli TaxID=1867834 RepID=A0ABQ5XS48_9GAMM|nr:DUF3828 domain-containing protein [Dyella acidisoli]GLQ94413.1 hypothetical protein GCM10007901_33650 [Dyella acidisoli]